MRNRICIINGSLILPGRIEKGKSLFIEGGRIIEVAEGGKRPSEGFDVIDARGLYVSPGFIDIHVHDLFAGRGDDIAEYDLKQMCGRMARSGVTAFLATTPALPAGTLLSAVNAVRRFVSDNPGTNLLGLHLEGPYLNPSSCGAQNSKYIRTFKPDELKKVFSSAGGLIRMMTFAPERENGMELLSFLAGRGVVPSIGHSRASYEETALAVKKGLAHVTHLFNAMPPLHHRDPGLTGAALALDGLSVDIIADGIHLHPAVVRFAVKAKGVDRVILISDRIEGPIRLKDGRLAGSKLGLNQAVRNVMEFADVGLRDAVRMAAINPARLLGIGAGKGSLEAGKDADVIIFNEALEIKSAIVKGNIVYGHTWYN